MPNDDERAAAFAALIVAARKRAKMTQKELEAASGVDIRTIARWEAGQATRPEAPLVRSLCNALEVHPIAAAIALGFVTAEEAMAEGGYAFTPTTAEVVEIFQDPEISEDVKEAWRSWIVAHHRQIRGRHERGNTPAEGAV